MVNTDIYPGTQVILIECVPSASGAREYAAGTAATVIGPTTTFFTGSRVALDVMIAAERITVWPHEVEEQVL